MLKIEYSLLSLIVAGTLIGVTYPTRLQHPELFLIAEVVAVVVVLWIIRLWLFINKPLQELNNALRLLSNNDFQSRLLPTPHPVVNKLVFVFNKMIDRIHLERVEQREQSYFLDHLIKATPHGIIILDYDEKIIQVNPTGLTMLEKEMEELVNAKLTESDNPLLSSLSNLPLNEPIELQLSGGRRYRCQKSAFIFKGFQQQFIIIQDLYLDDIKKEKKAYSKVIRMMSHEVNNSVGAINSYVDTLKLFQPSDQELKEDYLDALEIIKGRNNSMATFMKNFASVVKVPDPQLEEIDFSKVCKDLIQLYHSDFTSLKIKVENNLPEKLNVVADPNLIEQLLINVLKNAKEALIETEDERKIEISYNKSSKTISIWNSGPEISEEVEDKLFTPFYSSKTTGQGIGLMICRDVLVKHGWDFRLFTNERKGATFEIKMATK
ncbi:sensor histidine kinase [Flammeovirga agarivorans]|uniref:histidine kinase n=1 Tax=Flammeovirga agarivorans TaxID=2726742 RepID=A0A7X8XUN2_9BACT|nr:ATP-binding protein [Flammeovirga agarivorans]NLR90542.1 GHKL domain-containing protein [Flammeovirga agarivorans]